MLLHIYAAAKKVCSGSSRLMSRVRMEAHCATTGARDREMEELQFLQPHGLQEKIDFIPYCGLGHKIKFRFLYLMEVDLVTDH